MMRKALLLIPGVFAVAAWVAGCDDDVTALSPAEDEWTIMVYLTADDNIEAGVRNNIREMEKADMDPRVNVVLKGELPGRSTFRYEITGVAGDTFPVASTFEDLGERNMTDPNELREFIQWAQQNHPAQRSLLVLNDHGGGYTGLLVDPNPPTGQAAELMSIDGLRTALGGLAIDVLAFDACQMAGYETLVQIAGPASFAVFSEAQIPGNGFPYDQILNRIVGNPAVDGRTVAELIPDQYHESGADGEQSTTISSYDLTGFSTFESALNDLATDLQSSLETLSDEIAAASVASQKYPLSEFINGDTVPITQMTDLVNFLDSLEVRVTDDAGITAQIAALRSASLDPGFRLRNHFRSGTRQGQRNVDRSTGLNIILPSNIFVEGPQGDTLFADTFTESGDLSLGAYQALYEGRPWTSFLTAFTESRQMAVAAALRQGMEPKTVPPPALTCPRVEPVEP